MRASRTDKQAVAKRAAERRGRRAEIWAAFWLRLKGFRILARNHRGPAGEIDLIARRGRLLVAVEVKRREDLASAADAIGARQRSRIAAALAAYVGARPALQGCDLRFDALLIGGRGWPRHIPDAWRP